MIFLSLLTIFDTLPHILCHPQILHLKAICSVSPPPSLLPFSCASIPPIQTSEENCSCYVHLSDVKHISAAACQTEDRVSKFVSYRNTWQSLIFSHLSWNASETTHCRNMQTMIALHASRDLRTKADLGNELSDVWRTANMSQMICPYYYPSCISWTLKIPVVAGCQ